MAFLDSPSNSNPSHPEGSQG